MVNPAGIKKNRLKRVEADAIGYQAQPQLKLTGLILST
ncbi:hypothetical protein Mucpa_0773 [Mucilaginibacter paludis DSM 18603]|uniref:Uncharacterized protein n=1 Tax=Mucilaginibacter paludis DSM 18603 TaxID=714943 RepID=H1Y8D5_9SPHI|nr:hypothetical protein Mucpa_0773 [Mucilaginibacter paludis DSM 18603]